jgi:hypothetical protein
MLEISAAQINDLRTCTRYIERDLKRWRQEQNVNTGAAEADLRMIVDILDQVSPQSPPARKIGPFYLVRDGADLVVSYTASVTDSQVVTRFPIARGKIPPIKFVRATTGLGLKEAKQVVDSLCDA